MLDHIQTSVSASAAYVEIENAPATFRVRVEPIIGDGCKVFADLETITIGGKERSREWLADLIGFGAVQFAESEAATEYDNNQCGREYDDAHAMAAE